MKTFAKPASLLSILTALVFILAGCGQPDGGGEGAAPQTRFLSLGTAPSGGAFFVVGGALAEVADQYGAEYGWKVTGEATAGSQENIRRLTQGDLDFALSNAAITYFAVRGTADWDRAYPVQTVMTLAPNVALFIAPAGSEVESIADLRGRRVIIGPAGAGFEMFVGPILEAHGLTFADVTPLNATQSAAVDMLTDGSAAAAFLGGAVPTASISQAASSMDIRLVPFDEAAKQKLIADYLFFDAATIPAGTYRGQDADFHGLNVGSMHLITAESTDEELVYRFAKTIWDHRDSVVERHPSGRAIRPEVVVRDTGTSFHPGAIRLYRELGIWPEEGTPASGGDEAGTDEAGSDAAGTDEAGNDPS